MFDAPGSLEACSAGKVKKGRHGFLRPLDSRDTLNQKSRRLSVPQTLQDTHKNLAAWISVPYKPLPESNPGRVRAYMTDPEGTDGKPGEFDAP